MTPPLAPRPGLAPYPHGPSESFARIEYQDQPRVAAAVKSVACNVRYPPPRPSPSRRICVCMCIRTSYRRISRRLNAASARSRSDRGRESAASRHRATSARSSARGPPPLKPPPPRAVAGKGGRRASSPAWWSASCRSWARICIPICGGRGSRRGSGGEKNGGHGAGVGVAWGQIGGRGSGEDAGGG